MLQLQAFRYQLRPDGEQLRNLRRFSGSRRFVYNRALALQKNRYVQGEKKLGYAALCKELTSWRNSKETPWLAEAPVHPLQQSLRDLDRAYANFFAGRAEFPRFKKKGRNESFRYPDPLQFRLEQENNRISLPKLGWLRYRNSRRVEGELRNVTISLSAGRWFISMQTEREVESPRHPSISELGIDVGIANFATLSDGQAIAPVNALTKHKSRLGTLPAHDGASAEVRKELEQGESQGPESSTEDCRYAARLPAQNLNHDQPKPRGRICRGPPGQEDVGFRFRLNRAAWPERESKVRAQPRHPRSRLGRVPTPTRLQVGVARRRVNSSSAAIHQPDLSELRTRLRGEPEKAGCIPLCPVWLRQPRRSSRRDQRTQGWASPQSLPSER